MREYYERRAADEAFSNGACTVIIITFIVAIIIGLFAWKPWSNSFDKAENTVHTHCWTIEDVENEKIEFCKDCGALKPEAKHTHQWSAQKVNNHTVIICNECGKVADN